MTSMFNLFQNISKLIEAESINNPDFRESLLYHPSEYNINENSLFLDIGSGFGKPVFHAAFQVGCESKGIEVVPARVEFCIDFFYEFLNDKNFFGEMNLNSNIKNFNLNNTVDPKISEISYKNIQKTEGEINDNDPLCYSLKSPNHSLVSTTNQNFINEIYPFNSKIMKNGAVTENLSAITHYDINKQKFSKSDSITETVDLNFEKIINLNELNGNPYYEVVKDNIKSNLFLELRIDQEIIYDENFAQMLNNNYKIYKSILIEDNSFNFADLNDISNYNTSLLNFSNYFKLQNISVAITPIDDYIYSNLEKIILNTIYVDAEEREILKKLGLGQIEKLRKFSEIVKKIENYQILDFILYVNSIFNGKRSLLDLKKSNQNYMKDKFSEEGKGQLSIFNLNNSKSTHTKKPTKKKKDLYDELKEHLMKKENLLRDTNENNDATSENVEDTNILKQVLVDLKFNPAGDNWYLLTSFVALDATKLNNYSNDKKKHYTHIYSYNKLMSKECRSKIAKILNKTKFRVLAWYSNPKQTKKAGLKNFSFLCKFPMQSTSTEKFHVYVYIKTK